MLTSGAYRGFAAIRDQLSRIIATQIEEKPEPNRKKKTKIRSDSKFENPLICWSKTETQMLKTETPQTTMNIKTENGSFFNQ